MDEFELFKSNVCQMIKNQNSQLVIEEILNKNIIENYFENEEYDKALYLVAMIDYLSRRDHLTPVSELDEYRQFKLSEPVYPASAELITALIKNDLLKQEALANAIPEFLRFNIIEGEIENVY